MPEYHLGKEAVFEVIGVAAGTTTTPVLTTLVDLCLMDSVNIGSEEAGTISFTNWCTNGETRTISQGSQGVLEFGEVVFVNADAVLLMLRDSRNKVALKEEIFMRTYPLGKGFSMPFRDIRFSVSRYVEQIPVADIIKVDIGVVAANVPVYGITAAS